MPNTGYRLLRRVESVAVYAPLLVLLAVSFTLPAPPPVVNMPLVLHPQFLPQPAVVLPPVLERASRSVPRGALLSVTCYLPTGHRTASGAWPREGMAAGNRWPMGTRLRVPGVGVVTVEDRIGHGSDLDLFMTSRTACLSWGRRHLRVQEIP